MKKEGVIRYISVFLAVTVFVAFQLPFIQTAEAAGNSKTRYVIARTTYSYSDHFGSDKGSTVYTYYKNGLIKSRKSIDGKEIYKRDTNGLVTSYTAYNSKGRKESYAKNIIKDGKIAETRDYYFSKGKKKLEYTTKYTYDEADNMIRTEISNVGGRTVSTDYDSYGHILAQNTIQGNSSYLTKHTLTLDKHGNITKDVQKIEQTYEGDSRTYKHTVTEISRFTYSKTGKIKKYVYYAKGSKGRTTVTCTYNKAGKLKKIVSFTKNPDGTSEKSVENYTYKKVKVAKKYLKLVKSEQQNEQMITEQHLG